MRVLWGGLCAGAFLLSVFPQLALAQGRLDAHYEATLAGIPVGKGTWTIDIADDQFSAAITGGTSGLLKAFASGTGTGAVQGRIVNGAVVSSNYAATTTTPKPPVDPDRLPVLDAHRRGVLDPMTGSMLRVPGTGELLTPEACRSATSVFDGRMRYELKLDYKRMETVKAEKGYYGPVVVCAMYFAPIAGYIPDRPVIKYLAAQRNIEITFAPVAGTRILVPFRMVIPTPLGIAMLEATQFITQPAPPRVAKTN